MRDLTGSQLAVDLGPFPDPAAALKFEYTQPISGLFSEVARRFPAAIAVSDRLGEVTYAELEEWSSKLAHHLVHSGTAKGSIVTIYATRSASLVAALLAVGKAGATICVLDPSLPAKRVADEGLDCSAESFHST